MALSPPSRPVIAAGQADLDTRLPRDGTLPMTGPLAMGGNAIRGMIDDADPTSAVTRARLDAVSVQLDAPLRLARPYGKINSRTNATFNADGTWTRTTGTATLQWRVPLTAAQIAAGKVYVDLSGTWTLATVTQRTTAAAVTVAAVAMTVVGARRQLVVTLDASTGELLIDGQSTSANPLGSPTVGFGFPIIPPDPDAYYSAFGRSAAAVDGSLLAAKPSAVASSSGNPTVLNADGTVTVPASASGYATIPFDPLVTIAATDTITLLVEPISGGPFAPASNYYYAGSVTLYSADNQEYCTYQFDKSLGQKPLWLVEMTAGVAAGNAVGNSIPTSARFSYYNLGNGTTVTDMTVRVTVYKGAIPFIPAVPKTVQRALDDARRALPVKAVAASGTDLVRVDNEGFQHVVRVSPTDFAIQQATDERILALSRVAAGKAVAPLAAGTTPAGNDSAAGTTAAPLATLAAAYAATSAGQTIGLRNGQTHRYDASVNSRRVDRELVGYGAASTAAVIDFRQHVTGSWTATGDGGWVRSLTHRAVAVPSGSASAGSTTWKMYRGDIPILWCVTGTDIAANVAAAKASALAGVSAFEAHQVGSTTKDPRADNTGTKLIYQYTLYLADGADPATLDVSIQDVDNFELGNTSSVTTLGLAGKDHTHTDVASATLLTDYPLPTLHNYTSLEGNGHNHVGPCCTTGVFTGKGKPPPGFSIRTSGLNLYPGGHPNQDSTHDVLNVENANYMLYCHPSSSPVDTSTQPFYRSIYIKRIEGVGNIQMTEIIRGGGVALNGEFVIGEVYLFAHSGSLLHIGSTLGNTVNGGYVEFTGGGHMVLGAGTAANINTIRNLKWKNAARHYIGQGNNDTINFIGCEDLSDAGKTTIIFGNTSLCKHAIVIDNSLMGDLEPRREGWMPTSLAVKTGSRFGWGGRTSAEILAYFAAASIPCSIAAGVTIVGPSGNVIEVTA